MGKTVNEDCRRCSRQAGDPNGGCKHFHKGTCRPVSVFKAKECIQYIPMIVVATAVAAASISV